MRMSPLSLILAAVGLAQIAACTVKAVAAPDCLAKCWGYSKIVSSCLDTATHCLCADEYFQDTVYYCISSQCETAKLAPALHHALSQCYEHHLNSSSNSAPALIRRTSGGVSERHAKRDLPTASVPLHDYSRHSASALYNRPMRSARRVWEHAPGSRVAKPTEMLNPSVTPCPSITLVLTASYASFLEAKTPEPTPYDIDGGTDDSRGIEDYTANFPSRHEDQS